LERVTVGVPGRSYDVVIGSGVVARSDELLPELPGASRAFVVADRTVADAWFDAACEALRRRGIHAVLLTVPPGEDAKTFDVYRAVLQQLATQEAHRADPVVALGGGATGDLAGFVSSTYMRGTPFVQYPTTLTAQVDAAIGGKTAVNLPEGKNMIGAFHQPIAVIAEIDALATLPEREFRSGLAEVAKYALTLDLELLDELERDPSSVLSRDPRALERLVTRCVHAKAITVAADERDTGRRLVLNYGHTLGHALERLDAFAGRSHGEAVAIGMVFAARLSAERYRATDLPARTARLLASLGLETEGQLPSADEIVHAFVLDKKFHERVRFVLLQEAGRPEVVDDVPEDEVRRILREMGAPA
jgi:3-dehydroquinate synthase